MDYEETGDTKNDGGQHSNESSEGEVSGEDDDRHSHHQQQVIFLESLYFVPLSLNLYPVILCANYFYS